MAEQGWIMSEVMQEHLFGGFVDPVVLASRQGYHIHDGEVVLVRLQRGGAPVQEGPPLVLLLGVHSVCTRCCPSVCAALISPVPVQNLKSDAWLVGVVPRQLRSYIGLLRTW
jgi:hypothetical protein